MEDNSSVNHLLHVLSERAKELNCLYQIEELLKSPGLTLPELFEGIINRIPPGYQYPEICQARIIYNNAIYNSKNYISSLLSDTAEISVDDEIVGRIEVSYTRMVPKTDEGIFYEKEKKLTRTIADRIGQTIFHRKIADMLSRMENAKKDITEQKETEWQVIISLLKRTDPKLFINISRKMIYYLFKNGINESENILHLFTCNIEQNHAERKEDSNYPLHKDSIGNLLSIGDQSFKIASRHLTDSEILSCIKKWLQEDKAGFLMKVVDNIDTPLSEIIDAISRYKAIAEEGEALPSHTENWIKVELIRRFLSDDLAFIKIAKDNLDITDFYELIQNIIYPAGSVGRLGGKSTGLYLAYQILKKSEHSDKLFKNIRIPKTWHISSDGIIKFLHYNNLEEINEQRYKDIYQVKIEYPNIIQLLKNSQFPSSIAKSLSVALDDFGDSPLIVRSSSLLEDRIGTAFSGKYKSLFLANQGTKSEKLEALMDAIAEVYASVFGPDPIEYRIERELNDFHEEMGIMIQEVVGNRAGKYFFPTFAGVAFSSNEFRWSPRISRDDGLLRLVPGMGTRAVDRLSDDYPILISPGQPSLRVNITPEEIKRYSPRKIDVINLESNSFETVELKEILREAGDSIPQIDKVVSIAGNDMISESSILNIDFEKDNLVVTFESLIKKTPFIAQIKQMLSILSKKLGNPVDLEFASDGKELYLLQCRPQSSNEDTAPDHIPDNIPIQNIVFSANRYISNGRIPDITHIVYVDPESYHNLSSVDEMVNVGRAISRLNILLPKRHFILIGPGRWGSRGDIKLGVQVTYSDINNTAVLIELAYRKGNYVPELSFGTHFFQDLVESSIKYIPIYPDDEQVIFNEKYIKNNRNAFTDIAPEYSRLSETIYVTDIRSSSEDKILRILMNADISSAVGYLSDPGSNSNKDEQNFRRFKREELLHYRDQITETIVKKIDFKRFGVNRMFVSKESQEKTTGNIEFYIILKNEQSREPLDSWLEGWNLCLSDVYNIISGIKAEDIIKFNIYYEKEISESAALQDILNKSQSLKADKNKNFNNPA